MLKTLDSNQELASRARNLMLDYWDYSYKAIIRGFNSPFMDIQQEVLSLVELKNSRDYSYLLLTLFNSPYKDVRRRAALIYSHLGSFEDIQFQSSLKSSNYLRKESSIRALVGFKRVDLLPYLFTYIDSPNTSLQNLVLFGLVDYGDPILPYLFSYFESPHSQKSYLKILELIEGVNNEASIDFLISLLSFPDKKISQKSYQILQRMDPYLVILALEEQIDSFEGESLRFALSLLGSYKKEEALSLLISYFSSSDLQLKKLSEDLVRSFGQVNEKALLSSLSSSDLEIQRVCLSILIDEQSKALLVSEGSYDMDNIFLLFKLVESQTVEAYIGLDIFNDREQYELKTLYKIDQASLVYQTLRKEQFNSQYPYFKAYMDWEKSSLTYEYSRLNTFAYFHQFLNSEAEGFLKESSDLVKLTESLKVEVEKKKKSVLKERALSSDKDKQKLLEFINSRNTLNESWQSLTEEIQSLAQFILLYHSLSISSVIGEYSYFQSLPEWKTLLPN